MFKHDYEKEIQIIRNTADKLYRENAEHYNAGKIDEKELLKNRSAIDQEANNARADLIRQREYDIDRHEEKLLNKVVGAEDQKQIDRYRELYKKYNEMSKSKEELIKEYETSIKLNDETAGKAAAAVAVEQGIKEIVQDYSARNENFVAATTELNQFRKHYRAEFRRFYEYQGGKFAFVREPASRHERKQTGYILNENGHKVPIFKDKIIYKK